MNNKRTAR